jgi:hypothetical protein
MQKGFDVDIRRKQWVLDLAPRARRDADEQLLYPDPAPPSGGVLAATRLLQGAFDSALSVPSKTAAAAAAATPRAPAVAPETPAGEPARRGVSTAGLLHLYAVGAGAALLVIPAFVNYGPRTPQAIAVCVSPILLPAVALHLLAGFLDGLRAAPLCGAAALLQGVLLAVLATHGAAAEHTRWCTHLCVLLLQTAFALSLRARPRLAAAAAGALFALPVGVLEFGPWAGAGGAALVFSWQLTVLAVLAVCSAVQYRALALQLTRHAASIA